MSECEVKIRQSDYSALKSYIRQMFEMYSSRPIRRDGEYLIATMEKYRWAEIESAMKKEAVINYLD